MTGEISFVSRRSSGAGSSRKKMRRIFALLAVVLISSSALAIQVENFGPGIAGQLHALAYDPVDPNIIYAGGDNCGVNRSTNHGQTWELQTGGPQFFYDTGRAAGVGSAIPFCSLGYDEVENILYAGAESAALAIWVPLEDGESVAGVRWYNNECAKQSLGRGEVS